MLHENDFDTGDILLFSDRTFIPSRLIEYFTDSLYSHVAMVLKDPIYIDPNLKGLYIIESTSLTDVTDVEDNKLKNGVQIRKLESVYNEYNGAIMWRKLNVERNEEFYHTIKDAHDMVHNKPYDINLMDWFDSWLDVRIGNDQIVNRFVCSALIAYIYNRLNLIDKSDSESTLWTMIRPKDFGTENTTKNRLKFANCTLNKEIVIKSYDSIIHYVYKTY